MNQKIDNADPNAIMNQARAMASEHMTCIAREMVAWSNTGILPDGWLREIAKIVAPLSLHQDSLGMAEHIARKLMIERIACSDDAIAAAKMAIYNASSLLRALTGPDDAVAQASLKECREAMEKLEEIKPC